MAGGAGTRLRPLTCTMPKPMLPVANRPVIDYAVELLKKYGIHEIGVTLQYMPHMIMDHLGNGKSPDVSLEYFVETTPLGTAGSVKSAQNFLSDTFVVLSGDGITDIDLSRAIKFHNEKNADITIVLKKVANPLEYGVVITQEDGRIIRFSEKPNWSEVFSDNVNTGIYIINKNVLELAEDNKVCDFSNDLFPKAMGNGMLIYGYEADGYWCDIGNFKSYIQANIDAISGKINGIDFSSDYYEIKKDVWVGKYVKLDETAVLNAPCIIGRNSNIRANAVIHENCIIGDGSFIGRHTTVKNSILHDNVYIGNSCELRGAVISSGARIGDNTSVFEGSAIGSECSLGEHCIIKNGASLWPEKRIERGSIISDNVIWQSERFARYFDNECICGKINIDITPEFAASAAAVYSGMIKDRLVIAHNGTPGSEMLYSAVRAGAMAHGTRILELKAAPLPTARYAVRLFGTDGGIYAGVAPNGEAKLFFIDEKGSNVSSKQERSIENSINNRNINYASASDMSIPQNFDRCCDFYERHVIYTVGNVGANLKNFLLRVVNNGGIESAVLINLLSELNIPQVVCTRDELSKSDEFDLTVMLDDFGEKLLLFDDNLDVIGSDSVNLLLNYIALKQQKDSRYIIADYNAPEAVDIIAKSNNGVVVRTKSGTRALINEIVKHDGIADSLPVGKMSMYYDGIVFLLSLIGFMSTEQKSFRQIMSSMPEIHLSEKEVECPWNKRSSVMRRLAANAADDVNCSNGIKIIQKYGWSLVLPDAKRAVFKIYSEGFSSEYADELTDICVKKINDLANE